MGRAGDGPEDGDQHGATGDEDCASETPAREGFVEDEGCADGVEYQPRGLESGQDGEGEGCDLDGATDEVGDEVHAEP